ncbi:MAG: dTMP kinase [Candidatus Paceibacterota bacterium]|jgi:dTMP kinase
MRKNTYPGKFIVFEGLDGSGQSTQASLLRDYLIGLGKEVVLTKEPTKDSEPAKQIRKALDENIVIEPFELQKLFCLDRKEHLENLIEPALKGGKIVISDRYFFSTLAFGSSDKISLESLIELNKDFLIPDLTILLKVSPEVCVDRIEKRGEGVKLFEKRDKLAKVWETFRILPDRFENVYMVDGEKSVEEVFSQVESIINKEVL